MLAMRELVDLRRYPLGQDDASGYARLVGDARRALAECGAFVCPGFLTAPGRNAIVEELAPVLDQSYFKTKSHNVFLCADDPHFPADHPRNRAQTSSSATLAYDLLPADNGLERIYRAPAFAAFIAECLGLERLYPYGDALSPVNVLVYRPGAATGWHFDNAEFTVTILLQAGERGGEFEYAPFIRGDEDTDFDRLDGIIRGRDDGIRQLPQAAGSLIVFKGRHTLHRVRPVLGDRDRLVAVFAYAREPGTSLDPLTQEKFYGRISP